MKVAVGYNPEAGEDHLEHLGRSRRPGICIWCGGLIATGEACLLLSGEHEGGLLNAQWHLACRAAAAPGPFDPHLMGRDWWPAHVMLLEVEMRGGRFIVLPAGATLERLDSIRRNWASFGYTVHTRAISVFG